MVEPALHPAGVAADAAVGRLGQPDPLEQLASPALAVGLLQALEGGLQVEVLASGEDRVERSPPAARRRSMTGPGRPV